MGVWLLDSSLGRFYNGKGVEDVPKELHTYYSAHGYLNRILLHPFNILPETAGLLMVGCLKNDKNRNTAMSNDLCHATNAFNKQDSTGIIKGKIGDFADTSQSMSQGLMQIITDKTDTIIFNFDYDEAKSVSASKSKPGTCVEVTYYAEIQRVEVDSSEDGKRGDEISRHFYIREIKYLE